MADSGVAVARAALGGSLAGSLQPSPPEPDGSLGIRGGVGGVTFQFEELLRGAASLESVAEELHSVESEASMVRDELERYQADSSTGYRAWTAAAESLHNLAGVRQQLQRIAADVRSSHRNYECAEAFAALSLRCGFSIPSLTGLLFGPLTRGSVGLGSHVEAGIARAPRDLVQLLFPSAGPVAAGAVGALAGPTDARAVVRFLSQLRGLEFLQPRPIQASPQPTVSEEMDLTLPGLLRELDNVSSNPGEIEVVRMDRDDGPVFVLLIPGTQPGNPVGGDNPFDEAGIADGLGYDSQETGKAMRQALREAGANSRDRVVVAGHSQGGIHAMNLSQDRAFLAEFDLKYVVTAGSPVGGITPEPGIESIHLEHADDVVPALEGIPNPDTKDRVTVTLTDPAVLRPGEDPRLGPAHKLRVYEEGAKHIASSSNPSLIASTATLAGLVGVGGAASVTRVKLRRTPKPTAERPHSPPLPAVQPGVPLLSGTQVQRALPDVEPPRAIPSVEVRSPGLGPPSR